MAKLSRTEVEAIQQQRNAEMLSFMQKLLDEVPELGGVYREHEEYMGEVLSHVLLGDVTRFVIDQHRSELNLKTQSSVLNRCLDVLEQGMSAKEDVVQELVAVSFLENLAQSDELYFSLRERLGPASRAQLKLFEDEYGLPPRMAEMPNIESKVAANLFRDIHPGSR